jgi:UDP-N-acetylglucosamine 4,6-dehydratase
MDFSWKNKTIFITGGTGSWGHELVRQILDRYPDIQQIRIYSRGEHRQVDMQREFADPRLKFIIGDVRDLTVMQNAMKGSDIVIHLAALKHVPVCEYNTWEAVLTNINGTQNVIEAAVANEVEIVIDVSTDKAVDPFNFYGTTKAIGEKLMINANFNYEAKTKFICIRGGNVIGTNGSVIPLFKEQIAQKNEITLTNPKMTRFLMSTRQAIGLIFQALEHAQGGELFVMKMPGTDIQTLASTMVSLFGNDQTEMTVIGERPGEKLDEVLVSKNEQPFAYEFSADYFVILPTLATPALKEQYSKFPPLKTGEFSSANTHQLTSEELTAILRNEEWLWKN